MEGTAHDIFCVRMRSVPVPPKYEACIVYAMSAGAHIRIIDVLAAHMTARFLALVTSPPVTIRLTSRLYCGMNMGYLGAQ